MQATYLQWPLNGVETEQKKVVEFSWSILNNNCFKILDRKQNIKNIKESLHARSDYFYYKFSKHQATAAHKTWTPMKKSGWKLKTWVYWGQESFSEESIQQNIDCIYNSSMSRFKDLL